MLRGQSSTRAIGRCLSRLAALTLTSCFFVAAAASMPHACDFRTPAISAARVDWRAAVDQFRSEINGLPAVASAFTFSGQRRLPAFDPRLTPALVQLNGITSQIFTGIGRSPVPVLLPFDTAVFL